MKFLYKLLTTFLVIIILSFSLVGCNEKQVSLDTANILFNVIENLKSKTKVEQNNNFFYDSTQKKYFPDIKRILTYFEYKESFSYYNNEEDTTAVYYKYQKDTETSGNYLIKSDKFTYGLAIDNKNYVFDENSLKSKLDTTRSDNTIMRKHALNDFTTAIDNEITDKYYFNYVVNFFDLWTDTETKTLNYSDIENSKFYYKKGIYTLNCFKEIITETDNTTKEFNLSFNNDNITFIEIEIIKTNNNYELLQKTWNRLNLILQSGKADIPAALNNFENY